MNKAELVTELYARRGEDDIMTKAAADRIVTDILDIIKDGITKEGSARFIGFGAFEVVKRKARNGVNPQTGKSLKIPATKIVKFKPSGELKERVKKTKI